MPLPVHSRRAAFTIAECLVAITIFAVGVLGLAGTVLTVQRLADDSASRARAALLAWSRLEALRAAGCGAAASGSSTSRGIVERWQSDRVAGELVVTDSVSAPQAGGRPPALIAVSSAVTC